MRKSAKKCAEFSSTLKLSEKITEIKIKNIFDSLHSFLPHNGLFHFLSIQGVDELLQGGIDPKISRGFLMKIKKFPGGYKKK